MFFITPYLLGIGKKDFKTMRVHDCKTSGSLEAITGGVLSKTVLKSFEIFRGKRLCWSLLLTFNNVPGLHNYFEKHRRTAASG